LSRTLTAAAASAPAATSWTAGSIVAVARNLMNNLPAGLIPHSVLATDAPVPPSVTNALLIGVDLGPNLSVTGSLATILWLLGNPREGGAIPPWTFAAV